MVIIDRLDSSPFSCDDVVQLMHRSFEEHIKEGLFFTCSSLTVSQFVDNTRKGLVLVAWDTTDITSLLGTATVTLKRDKHNVVYGYHEYLAINPSAKRLGIGTRLLKACISIISKAGGEYVMSDTAVGANSSVKWHKKNGFKIVGLESFASTKYYSYLFRKQLIPSKKWDNSLYCYLTFVKSAIKTRLKKKADGNFTVFYMVYNRLK